MLLTDSIDKAIRVQHSVVANHVRRVHRRHPGATPAEMVPGGLPKSASAQRSWWGNSPGRVQARAWLAAGFEVTDVDLTTMTVRFDRRSLE